MYDCVDVFYVCIHAYLYKYMFLNTYTYFFGFGELSVNGTVTHGHTWAG